MDAKAQFFAILKAEWSPSLRQHGFKGSGQHYQRRVGEVLHAINVQVNKYGGSCCVNLGVHPAFLPTPANRMIGEADQIRAIECEFRWRLTPEGFTDYWWAFERGDGAHLPYGLLDETGGGAAERAHHLMQTYADHGEPRFQSLLTVEDLARSIQLDDLDGDLPPIYTSTKGRAALTMARIHDHLGNIALARRFAEVGLNHALKAKAVTAELTALLERTR